VIEEEPNRSWYSKISLLGRVLTFFDGSDDFARYRPHLTASQRRSRTKKGPFAIVSPDGKRISCLYREQEQAPYRLASRKLCGASD
jgi:hypothetical protein